MTSKYNCTLPVSICELNAMTEEINTDYSCLCLYKNTHMYYLSVHEKENKVDLYHEDDKSGRQHWKILSSPEDTEAEFVYLLANGRKASERYLGKLNNTLILFNKPNINCQWIKQGTIDVSLKLMNSNNDCISLPSNIDDIDGKLYIKTDNITLENYYLSVHETKDIVDLYFYDDASGRQKWIISNAEDSEQHTERDKFLVILKEGRKDKKKYLTYTIIDNSISFKIRSTICNNSYFNVIDNKLGIPRKLAGNPITEEDIKSHPSKDSAVKKPLKIFLRGHIRTGFNDSRLLDFITVLDEIYDIKIYIHTWIWSEANKSWRKLNTSNKKLVTKSTITSYFQHLSGKIASIMIEDDTKLKDKLVGKTIFKWKTCLPLICWKFMWYGQYSGLHYLKDKEGEEEEGEDIYVLNTRFDIFNVVYNSLDHSEDSFRNYARLISKCIESENDIRFIYSHNVCGIDNFYVGKINKMCDLIDEFHLNLDKHLDTMPPYQEHEVFITAHKIFSNVDGGF